MKPNVTAPRGRAVQTWHHDPAPFSHAAMARTIEFIMYHPPLGPGAIRTTMNKTQRWTGACSAQPRMDMATKNVRRSTRALETRTANQQNLPARDRPIVTINLAVFVPSYQVLYRLSPRCCMLHHQQRHLTAAALMTFEQSLETSDYPEKRSASVRSRYDHMLACVHVSVM